MTKRNKIIGLIISLTLIFLTLNQGFAKENCFSIDFAKPMFDLDTYSWMKTRINEDPRWVGYQLCFNSSSGWIHREGDGSNSFGGPCASTDIILVSQTGEQIDAKLSEYIEPIGELMPLLDGLDSSQGPIKNLSYGNSTIIVDSLPLNADYAVADVCTGTSSDEKGTRYTYVEKGYLDAKIGDRIEFSMTAKGMSSSECQKVFQSVYLRRAYDDTPQYFLQLANRAYRNKSYNQALDNYSKVIDLDPSNREALNSSAFILSRIGRYEDAAEAFRLSRPNSAREWYLYGLVLLKLNLTDEAEYAFSEMKQFNDNTVT